MGNLSHQGLIIAPGQEANGINLSITKTCLYNFDPLKPHLYVVKLGFTGVYIIFLISAQNLDCGYLLEPPRRQNIDCGYSLEPPRRFEQKYEKYPNFYLKIFHFLVVKFSVYFNRHVFVMGVFLIFYEIKVC